MGERGQRPDETGRVVPPQASHASLPAVRRLLIYFLLPLPCCSGKEAATFLIAQGSAATLSPRHGPCDFESARPAGVVSFDETSRQYRARSVGRVRIGCEQSDVVIDVRPVDHIEIDGPGLGRVGDNQSFVVRAFDKEGNPLLVSDDDPVTWRFEGALQGRAGPGCGDLMTACTARNKGYAVTIAAGQGLVHASFHGHDATHPVRVVPPETDGR
jgi:hypothetical protein